MFTNSDVKFYLSGGESNNLKSLSFGGVISTTEITDSTNNLFGRVSQVQSEMGYEDYRCFYIVNESDETLTNFQVSLSSDVYTLGMKFSIEKQKIILGGYPVGGSFTIKYRATINGMTIAQNTNPILFSPNPVTQASLIQAALNELDYLSDVIVSGEIENDFWVYVITFPGFKRHNLLELVSNDLLGSITSIEITGFVDGSPINAICSSIGVVTQVPFGVEFTSSFSLEALESLDAIGVWVKRVIEAGNEVSLDEATLTISASI